jgi:hypothetical protein
LVQVNAPCGRSNFVFLGGLFLFFLSFYSDNTFFLSFFSFKLLNMAFKINTLQNYKCENCNHISNYEQMLDDSSRDKPFCHDKLCPKCKDVMIDLWQQKIYAKKTK